MSKATRLVQDEKQPHKPKPSAPQVEPTKSPDTLTGSLDADSAQVQAERLNDPRLQLAQRQALAAHIGQMQGNRYLSRVIALAEGETGAHPSGTLQAKLTVNPAGDPYEQEADQVADRVMRAANAREPQPAQALEEEEPLQVKSLEARPGAIQRWELEGPWNIGDPVHELLTQQALRGAGLIGAADTYQGPKAWEYVRGAIWNDDPDALLFDKNKRRTNDYSSGIAWYRDFKRGEKKAGRGEAIGTDETLLVRSHHGDLQFLHGMAEQGEAAALTQGRIMMWAEFTYKVATGEIAGDTLLSAVNVPGFQAMFPRQAKLTVEQLFGIDRQYGGGDVAKRAAGSLLHMIQDTYSASHTERETNNGKKGKITSFHAYSTQDHKKHAAADVLQTGKTLEEQIRNTPGAQEAIDQGVRILRLISEKRPWGGEKGAQRELEDVFGLAPTARPAGPGEEFKPDGAVQRKSGEEDSLAMSSQVIEQDRQLQRQAEAADQAVAVTAEVEDRIQAMRSGGQPLPDSERDFFEAHLGRDLSQVRVHTDDQAAQLSREVNARAFTVGSDIAFGAGQYAPGTPAGRQLMAHELTHVVQQGGAPHQVQRKPAKSLSYASNAEGYFDVANQITSIMEGGSSKGRYDALTTIDDGGIISYGKHQATLSSGSLGTVLEAYIASSQSATAEVIRGYMDRVRRKDATLKNEKAFLDALRSAANEKEMQIAQDLVFSKGYWNPAVTAAQGAGIQSPLGYAMLYDTKIQGGMEACLKAARTACGGDVGQKVGAKIISEIEFLTAFNDAREERLERIAQAAEKDSNRTKANAVRGSKYRCAAFRELLKAGNLNVAGPGGEVEILGPGKKPYKIEGFDLGEEAQEDSGHKPDSDRSAQSPEPVIGTATVTASALNVRQAPSAEAAKLGVLLKDQQVDVTGREGNWLRVVYRSAPAFINSNYAMFTPRTVASQPGLLGQIAGFGRQVWEGIAGAAQTAWKWVTGLFGSGQPGGQTQTPGEEKHSPAYESQRDNAYSQKDDLGDLVRGDVMCNVTTLAMQIETLAGSQEKAVWAAVSLLIKNDPTLAAQSDKLCKQQLEDLIMLRFSQISAGKPGWKKVLGNEYADAAKLHDVGIVGKNGKTYKYGWHEQAACLRCVGAEFTEFVSLDKDKKPVTNWPGEGGMKQEYYQNMLRPKIERDRATVMLSTNLTSGGHIVLLAQVLDEGILINDPYGALLDRQGNYLKNGANKADAVNRLRQARKGILEDRLKHNRDLLKALTKLLSDDKLDGGMPQNLGELNFYTWDEVKAFSMGKWNNILYGKP